MRSLLLLLCCIVLQSTVRADPAPPAQAAAPFIARYAAEHQFSGTILIRENGKTTYRQSFGLANRSFRVANNPLTRYRIASITKTFTATLILQRVAQGKLDLHKSIRSYLPDYTGSGGDKVSVHQLLNHTSGLPNFDTVKDLATALAEGIPVYQRPYSTEQLLSQFCSQDLIAEPGSAFDYNNADYIVLGKIIEKQYGKPFDQVLAEQILKPLGMVNTGMLKHSDVIDQLANTYFLRPDLNAIVPDLPAYPENWYAAGAMYSSVDDLAVFADALFGGKLISPAMLALMLKPGLDDYGYGAWSYESTIAGRNHSIFKRPGQIMGAQTQLYRIIDAGITVIILSNVGNTDLDEFVAQIGKRVLQQPAR